MIDALIGGSLVGAPQEKTGASGKTYVRCRVRVPTGDDSALFVLATAFDGDVQRALMALASGDPVALAGPLKLGVWAPPQGEARVNASMVVSAVLTPYHVKRRRDAMQGRTEPAAKSPAPARTAEPLTAALPVDPLDDAF
jgi:Single-strand binding protein family